MLGGRNEDIDALVFEQGVESRRVEGAGFTASCRASCMSSLLPPHRASDRPLPTLAACSGPWGRSRKSILVHSWHGRQAPLYLLGACALAAVLLFYTFSR